MKGRRICTAKANKNEVSNPNSKYTERKCGGKRSILFISVKIILVPLHVLLLVFPSPLASPLVKRAAEAMSLAEGNAEPISAMNGFYGNPLYRLYL